MSLEQKLGSIGLILFCAVACSFAGCSSEEPPLETIPWFVGEYVDPSHPGGAVRLDVSRDGTFTLTQCEHWEAEGEDSGTEIARGRWASLGDGLELQGDEWSAALMSDEIAVTLLSRSDTLPGLRCTETRGSALLDSVRLMRYRDFADFVHPPEGSGSSTGGL
jgi:hypothetical protein